MKNPILYLFLVVLMFSCAKRNQTIPAKLDFCTVRSFKYSGVFSADNQQYAKVFSTYRGRKYEMDSIVETDSNGHYLKTLIKRTFDENSNLKTEELPDKKLVYTVQSNKCIKCKELSLTNELIREFNYEYDKRLLTKIFVDEGGLKDTIQLFYPFDYGQITIRPIKIIRHGGKIRYYRNYDFYNNLIKDSYAEYSNPNSPDSVDKQTDIYSKTFDIFSHNNFIIQKYITNKDLGNLLHTKFDNTFYLGRGVFIPRMDDADNTNWEPELILNEQKQLKSYSHGQYGFGNISEFKYSCE